MGVFISAFSYIASVIGAGFASGQEMISFFVKYGKWSILGIILSSVIFGFFAYAVTEDSRINKISDYNEYLDHILPRRLKTFVKFLTIFFSLITFCTMAAGSGAMFSELFNISKLYGNIALCLISLFFLVCGSKKALEYNGAIGFVIIIGVISVCLYIIGYREHQTFLNVSGITVSALSYAGYNLITAGIVLTKLSPLIKDKTSSMLLGFICGFIMFFIMFLMWIILSIYYEKIELGEMPMLTMAIRQNIPTAVIYSILLFLSILSTAIASGIGFKDMLNLKLSIPLLLVCAITFGSTGFTNLINTAYRLCGYAGIILPFYIIFKKIKK